MVASTIAGILATTAGHWTEIVVIDDASAHPIDVSGPAVTVIRNPEPIGTSRARRLGAECTTGSVLFWMDAHMTFGRGWLEAMLAEVDSGALLCSPWRNYTRSSIHCWGADFRWSEERDYARRIRPGFDFGLRLRPIDEVSRQVPMVVGACYVMRRDAYHRTGGFCPLFRIYGGEEPDLSARAWLSGGSVRCVAGAEVGHLDRTEFPYSVSFDHVEFNQIVMIRSLFEEATASVLEEFFYPLPAIVLKWLAGTDIAGWRSVVQARRRMSDAEFFRRIAPGVPLSFHPAVRARRGHMPAYQVRLALAEEQRLAAKANMQAIDTDSTVWEPHGYKLVHAGVVAWLGEAIILPGGDDTGRPGLLAALARAGATIYSHTYAVLDSEGRVHPYLRHEFDPVGMEPLSVGLVASVRYLSPDCRWQLQRTSEAEAALDLLGNAVGGRDDAIFRAVNRAVDGVVAFQGQRGQADPLARALIRHLELDR